MRSPGHDEPDITKREFRIAVHLKASEAEAVHGSPGWDRLEQMYDKLLRLFSFLVLLLPLLYDRCMMYYDRLEQMYDTVLIPVKHATVITKTISATAPTQLHK